ncbi:MAG: ADP-glyceromanno-heptose 6-epimerase [Leptospirales bacterium]|nr:ADP-glyceromanno-heptose 6-epimerase [Leptospirales bacterium]
MIIVTGAAGLIGSAVARQLNERGERNLLLVDHLGVGDKWMNLRSLAFSDYLEKDEFLAMAERALAHPGQAPEFNGLKAIVHLGANSATTEKDASHLIQNNYRYSIRMAELARMYGVRFVYASSAATYGEGENGFEDNLEELQRLRPLNAYGYSKQMFDLWMRRFHFETSAAGIKYFNVYGPNEYHKGEMMSLVLKAYRQIVGDGKLRLFKSYKPEYKDGEQMRDFLYVKDAARMTVHLLLDSKASGVFNAGSGLANTWLDLARAIFAALKLPPQIEFVDMPDYLRPKYQYYTCAPIHRLRQTGYNGAVTPLADAVQDYVAGYLAPGELRA